jgi:hypothetical protein
LLDRGRDALVDDGHFVFETRAPAARAREHRRAEPASTIDTAAGSLDYSVEVTEVDPPLASFRQTTDRPGLEYVFIARRAR